MKVLSLFFVIVVCSFSHLSAAETARVAFLGDSISTGAVTHPSLEFNKPGLWKILRGGRAVVPDPAYLRDNLGDESIKDLRDPIRLWPSAKEYLNPLSWLGLHFINAVSRVYLDTEAYSWSAMLSQRLGYAPQETVIAAQDGARAYDAIHQVDRLLDYTDGATPEKIFLFFTGNDLCGHTMDYVTSSDDYAAYIERSLIYLARNGLPPQERGTDVYVVSFMGILQLTGNQDILEKVVPAAGQIATCKEVGAGKKEMSEKDQVAFLKENPDAAFFLNFFPDTPATLCPTVFEQNIDRREDQRSVLANRIRAYRETTKAAVLRMGQRQKNQADAGARAFRFHFVDDTSDLIFAGEDIANDCFHLSVKGQNKVAKAVANGLSKL